MQKRLKKGFTLAELLIVVAIIAVLTAIAVPLFVNALTDAKKNTKNANIAAVREAAVTFILTNTDNADLYTDGVLVGGPFYAAAHVTATGEVENLKVATDKTAEGVAYEKDQAVSDGDGGYNVTVQITNVKGEFAKPKAVPGG